MNILITAGGTSEKIDEVRKITNMSTGKLGAIIADEIFKQCKGDYKLFYICSKNAELPSLYRKGVIKEAFIEVIRFESTVDLEKAIHKVMALHFINYFIHSAAVSDFTVDSVVDDEGNSLGRGGKISSRAGMTIHLKPTPKIISQIKKLQPYTFLVGFKLLDKVSKDELFDTAFSLLRSNHCNLVLANDLACIREGNHEGMLVYPEKRYDLFDGKDAIAKNLVEIMFKRGACRHPKSIHISDQSNIFEATYETFHKVGEALDKSGFLPHVEGGTYGNMSKRVKGANSFFVTGRNVNKGDIPREHIVGVQAVLMYDEGHSELSKKNPTIYSEVFYDGKVKPSIDTTIHSMIYKATDHDAILHVHTDKIFDYPLTDYNYPCGSDAEADLILKLIKENPEADIIQMDKHGLIVMGPTLEECLAKTEKLFSEAFSIRKYDSDTDKEAFTEWIKHYKEVSGRDNFPAYDTSKFYIVRKGDEALATLFVDTNGRELSFVAYGLQVTAGRKLGVVKEALKVLTQIAKTNGITTFMLLTTEACNIKDFYIQKHGFKYVDSHENILVLTKEVK